MKDCRFVVKDYKFVVKECRHMHNYPIREKICVARSIYLNEARVYKCGENMEKNTVICEKSPISCKKIKKYIK